MYGPSFVSSTWKLTIPSLSDVLSGCFPLYLMLHVPKQKTKIKQTGNWKWKQMEMQLCSPSKICYPFCHSQTFDTPVSVFLNGLCKSLPTSFPGSPVLGKRKSARKVAWERGYLWCSISSWFCIMPYKWDEYQNLSIGVGWGGGGLIVGNGAIAPRAWE